MVMYEYTFDIHGYKVHTAGECLSYKERCAIEDFWNSTGASKDERVVFWANSPFYVVDCQSGECLTLQALIDMGYGKVAK